jgi:cysteine desulfurase/selenocysteine lyase
VGVLYAKEHLLAAALPFQYGGDMIAEGGVSLDRVEYNHLPWKYAAGTPNILGVIVSAQALRLVLDLVLDVGTTWFGTSRAIPPAAVRAAMDAVGRHTREVTSHALRLLQEVEGLRVYGPAAAGDRSPLVAFTIAGMNPTDVARRLDDAGVESRAGCHCAALAHRDLGLTPPASCRLSFALYTTTDEVDQAVGALRRLTERPAQPSADLGVVVGTNMDTAGIRATTTPRSAG